jgi:hypothetical protein
MKNDNHNAPMPTPYELSKLAIMAGEWTNNIIRTHNEIEKVDPIHTNREAFEEEIDQAVELAMAVWKKSATSIQVDQDVEDALKVMLDGIFTIPNDEWRERIKAFKGYKGQIKLALNRKKLPTETVKKVLFPDKNDSRAAKDKMMLALPKFAVLHKVTMWDGWLPNNNDIQLMELSLKVPTLSADNARYFYEVRQIQIASNRRHGKP